MKMLTGKKIIISILMALTLVFGCVSPAFAESADTADTDVSTDTDTELFEAIDTDIILSTDADASPTTDSKSNTYSLTLGTYTEIYRSYTTSSKTATVTNSFSNPDGILVRAANSAGEWLGSVVAIAAGSSGKVKIPSGTGTYIIYAKPVSSGSYYITVSI